MLAIPLVKEVWIELVEGTLVVTWVDKDEDRGFEDIVDCDTDCVALPGDSKVSESSTF